MKASYRSRHGMHSFTRHGKKDIVFTQNSKGEGELTTEEADVQAHIEGSVAFARGVIVKIEEPVVVKTGPIKKAIAAIKRKLKA